MKTCITLALALATGLAAAAPADVPAGSDPALVAFIARMKAMYPGTQFKAFRTTPIPGLYEVVMGRNVAQVDETGRYFVMGHMLDMQTQHDLSEAVATEVARVRFADLPLKDAIKTVKGSGRRVVAVFSDPDCPYCRQLEKTLATMTDVTVYTFLFPIEGLHPSAHGKADAVWCAPDRAAAWQSLMLKGEVPATHCADTPVARNQHLAESLGIRGTPSLVFASGQMVPGALQRDQLEALLERDTASATGASQ
jgi:thiol:disulfide interchange protein DsbC